MGILVCGRKYCAVRVLTLNRIIAMVVGFCFILIFLFVPETFWDRTPKPRTEHHQHHFLHRRHHHDTEQIQHPRTEGDDISSPALQLPMGSPTSPQTAAKVGFALDSDKASEKGEPGSANRNTSDDYFGSKSKQNEDTTLDMEKQSIFFYNDKLLIISFLHLTFDTHGASFIYLKSI